jgi:hypothetical protein
MRGIYYLEAADDDDTAEATDDQSEMTISMHDVQRSPM